MSEWNPALIAEPTTEALRSVGKSYEAMLSTILDAILKRYERDPDYPFIDTKLNLMTSADFEECPNLARDFKSKRIVYGWIQRRFGGVGGARWKRGKTLGVFGWLNSRNG